ncbi:hypothetical protein AGLY_011032 [Aphis glycines]|uniref:HAT C-terminal dimerisation domain-containing protein n=1 Tax=Aphis glycines TaxID=307491 RepID=A0A6G0TC95_APHGL|nr:hypothetical protein AGLY_011032 [Aphis glycines]
MVSSTTFLAAAMVRPLISCSRTKLLSPDGIFFSEACSPLPPTSDVCLFVPGRRRLSTDAALPASSSVSDACCLKLSIKSVTRSINDGNSVVPSLPTMAPPSTPPPPPSSLLLLANVPVAYRVKILIPSLFSLKSRFENLKEKKFKILRFLITLLISSLTKRFNLFFELPPEINEAILATCFHPNFKLSLCSSAPVERLFSFASFVLSPSRSNLSNKMFEKLIFLKDKRSSGQTFCGVTPYHSTPRS